MGTWVFGKWPRERISNRWKNMWRNTAVGTHPYVASSSTVLALDTIDFTTAVLDAFYVLRPLPDVKGCTQLMKLKYIIWITCTWFKRPVQDKRNNLSSDCISRFDACVLVSPGDRPDFCDVSWCCLFILHLSYHIISINARDALPLQAMSYMLSPSATILTAFRALSPTLDRTICATPQLVLWEKA